MSNFKDISYDEIFNKIMEVLFANPGKTLTKREVYNKTLDNFDSSTYYIDPDFKMRFMAVLESLPIKIQNILITSNHITYDLVLSDSKENDQVINVNNDDTLFVASDNVLPSNNTLSLYLVDNDLYDHFYKNIYHDLIKGNNVNQINKIISVKGVEPFLINLDIQNKSPIEYVQSLEVNNLFLKNIYLKNKELTDSNNQLIKKNNVLESKLGDIYNLSFYDLFSIKIIKFIEINKNDINFVFYILFLFLLLFLNEKSLKLFIFFILTFNLTNYIFKF